MQKKKKEKTVNTVSSIDNKKRVREQQRLHLLSTIIE